MTALVVSEIQVHGEVAIFEISKRGLAMKAGGEIVYEKSREELLKVLTMKDGVR